MFQTRTTLLPDGTTLREVLIPAVLNSVDENTVENANGTESHWCTATYEHPTLGTKQANGSLWAKSLTRHSERFKPGSMITLAVQAEGQYRGKAKVELPSIGVDLSGMEFSFDEEEVATKADVAESI